MPTTKVPDHVRVYIVTALARYLSPSEVTAAVKREFDLDVSRQYVYALDPTAPHASAGTGKVAKRWRDLHAGIRAAFHKALEAIPIADQAVRLQRAETLYHQNARNPVFQKELLEYAAKEAGGLYTNTRKVQGTLTVEQQIRALATMDQGATAPAGPGLLPRTGEVFPE